MILFFQNLKPKPLDWILSKSSSLYYAMFNGIPIEEGDPFLFAFLERVNSEPWMLPLKLNSAYRIAECHILLAIQGLSESWDSGNTEGVSLQQPFYKFISVLVRAPSFAYCSFGRLSPCTCIPSNLLTPFSHHNFPDAFL